MLSRSVRHGSALKHWINGGETTPDNLTLLCTHHYKLLHEGGFGIVKEADETLRFVTDDGRTIPRCGYRLEDFVDDVDDGACDAESASPSREGFCTTTVQRCVVRDEVREPAAIYRLRCSATG